MLLARDRTEEAPADFLRTHGEVFAVFDGATQDSGNVSYGVRVGTERFFVKTAGDPGDSRPVLPHLERVALLRNAVRIGGAVSHPGVPALRHIIESRDGSARPAGGERVDRFATMAEFIRAFRTSV